MEQTDPVRIEVETALKRSIPVIPVLIDGAAMPSGPALPETLAEFAFRNATEVDSGRDFHHHMDRLVHALDRILESAYTGAPRVLPAPNVATPTVPAAPTPVVDAPIVPSPATTPPPPVPSAKSPKEFVDANEDVARLFERRHC
jgi:hypothetical protein